ncbi:RNA polymerase factor sigma-54, partial [Clostridiaceae bacterium UIB06]|nr:RNA polymerase factor sigma-54 [Clostridiaceae bacterium UIB06]
MDFGLNLTQEQKLVMTQEMQLSVKLLQMSGFELQEYVEKEVQENPVLDAKVSSKNNEENNKMDYKELVKYFEFDNYSYHNYEKRDEDEVSPFNFISEKKSLKEYLKEQIRELGEKGFIKSICLYIIENIDERGYLEIGNEELSKDLKISLSITEYCVGIIQSLEPSGIGARNLKECLKMQVTKKGIDREYIFEIIDNYLELLAENKYNTIAKKLDIDVKKAQEYGDIIKTLHPKPSRGFFTGEEVKYITP